MRTRACPSCGRKGLATLRAGCEETITVAGVKFVGRVPCERCSRCKETVVSAEALVRLELAAAHELLALGHRTGAVLRFARKTLGLTGRELGEELGVAAETISRWENDERDIDTHTLAVVADLVRDRLAGTDETRTMLRALRAPSPRGSTREPIRLRAVG